jgi:hypothetical protein
MNLNNPRLLKGITGSEKFSILKLYLNTLNTKFKLHFTIPPLAQVLHSRGLLLNVRHCSNERHTRGGGFLKTFANGFAWKTYFSGSAMFLDDFGRLRLAGGDFLRKPK